ncbi:hypothetical protein SAMN06265219_102248 [Gracilimonas mengyeensis]|uniref:Uncharacterized protein n=1 Tax=Gracilimonas mengyeensis TaxID=1302730 RepID=A0A521BFZ9_9BACT|nr:hypothetical protein SAMN06265219_102248 [Gracilimonas mengyeensis]
MESEILTIYKSRRDDHINSPRVSTRGKDKPNENLRPSCYKVQLFTGGWSNKSSNDKATVWNADETDYADHR